MELDYIVAKHVHPGKGGVRIAKLSETTDSLALNLVDKRLMTNQLVLAVGYDRENLDIQPCQGGNGSTGSISIKGTPITGALPSLLSSLAVPFPILMDMAPAPAGKSLRSCSGISRSERRKTAARD